MARKKEVDKIDQKNLQIVKKIIEKHGWLGQKELGFKASQTLFMVIQHADHKTQKRYLPLLKKAFSEGKVAPANYAMYLDRTDMGSKKPQTYGTQVLIEKNVFDVYPLLNVDSVDVWRRSLGLDSLKNYLHLWNINWDVEEYKRNLPTLKDKYNVIDKV